MTTRPGHNGEGRHELLLPGAAPTALRPAELTALSLLRILSSQGWRAGHQFDNGEIVEVVLARRYADGAVDTLRVRSAGDAQMRRTSAGSVTHSREGTVADAVGALADWPRPAPTLTVPPA